MPLGGSQVAIKFLGNIDEQPKHSSNNKRQEKKYDRRSYCANSDSFYSHMDPIASRRLSENESKRQAECYRL